MIKNIHVSIPAIIGIVVFNVFVTLSLYAEKPIIPQCGQQVVYRSCQLLGIPLQMQDILQIMPPNKEGDNLLSLRNAFDEIGLKAVGIRETYDGLKKTSCPAIAHLNGNHYVVVIKADEKNIQIFDSEGRARMMTAHDFRKAWDGALLTVERASTSAPLPKFMNRIREGVPCIEFNRTIIDKGDIPWVGEKPIPYEYTVTNTGESLLRIENIKTDCSCMGSEYSKEPIPPGGESKIILKYSLAVGGGAFFHEAFVKSNDPQLPLITLAAAGNTDTRVLVKPKSLLFDEMTLGQTRTETIHLHHSGDEPLEITHVTSEKQRAKFTDRKLTHELAQEYYGITNASKRIFIVQNSRILQVTYEAKEEDLGKEIKDSVVINTNIPGFEKITIPVIVKVVPPVALYPGLLTFVDVNPDKVITKSIQAVSLDGKGFRVISIHEGNTRIDYSTSPEFSNQKEIILSANGKTLLALSEKDLEVEVEMKGPESRKYIIKMPVHAYSQEKSSLK